MHLEIPEPIRVKVANDGATEHTKRHTRPISNVTTISTATTEAGMERIAGGLEVLFGVPNPTTVAMYGSNI